MGEIWGEYGNQISMFRLPKNFLIRNSVHDLHGFFFVFGFVPEILFSAARVK